MTERKYVFTFTHFQCGCAYRTIGDTAVFCPQHREIITGTERIETPEPKTPDVPGMVMDPYLKGTAQTLRNTRHNSIHVMTSVLDGQGDEWDEPSEEMVGLCGACFIDEEQYYETQVAMCECGKEKCSYRWCGSTEGLHAFWRLHAQGKSEETTGIPERDIFNYGQYSKQSSEVASALDQEREDLRSRAGEMTIDMESAREQAKTSGQTEEQQTRNQQSVYLTPWLDRDYQAMTGASDPREQERARRTLQGKITRLHVIGTLPPAETPKP